MAAERVKLSVSDAYAYGAYIRLPDGRYQLKRERIQYSGGSGDKYHVLKEGEFLDELAYQYYGAYTKNPERYSFFIADVNKILNPLDLSDRVGTRLIIPDFYRIRLNR